MLNRLYREFMLRSELRKALKAVAFLGSESSIRLVVGFFVHTWMARVLGPVEFGELIYIRNFAYVFFTFSLLGLDDIFIKSLINEKNRTEIFVSEVFVLRFCASTFFYLIYSILVLSNEFGSERQLLQLSYGLVIFLQPLLTFEAVFLSKLQNKEVFQSRLSGYLLGSTGKLTGVTFQLSVPFFTVAYSLEEIVSRSVIAFKYFKSYSLKKVTLLSPYQKDILKSSFPLFCVGGITLAEQRLGFYFLEKTNEIQLGFYSVSTTLIELWYFFPIVIATSLFPKLVESKKIGSDILLRRTQYVVDVCVWTAFGLCTSVYFLAEYIINILYGDRYLGADHVFRLVSLTVIPVFFNFSRSKYFVLQDELKSYALLIIMSFCINLGILSYFRDEVSPAIIVSSMLFSSVVSNVVFSVFNREVRKTVVMLLNTLTFPARALKRLAGRG